MFFFCKKLLGHELLLSPHLCVCFWEGEFSPVIQVSTRADAILAWYICQKITLPPASPSLPWPVILPPNPRLRVHAGLSWPWVGKVRGSHSPL